LKFFIFSQKQAGALQDIVKGIIGGFLKLSPVKQALMSDTLRSTFLAAMNNGVKVLGKGCLHDLP